jgi:hypothetical protein
LKVTDGPAFQVTAAKTLVAPMARMIAAAEMLLMSRRMR